MTRARRLAATVLCAGLAVGIAWQLHGRLNLSDLSDLSGEIGGPTQSGEVPSGSGNHDQAAAPLPDLAEPATHLSAAHTLLSMRAAAVKDRSKSAWMSTVDPRGSSFRKGQSVMFDNLMKLPLGQFSYLAERLAAPLTPARVRQAGPRAWAATVTAAYSLAGFDREPQSYEVTYTMVWRTGGWRIAADSDASTAMQIWDLPRLSVLRGSSSIVIGNAPRQQMREYRTMADSAVQRVSAVWGKDWGSRVVILLPSTKGEFARMLTRPADSGLDQVAAITQGAIAPGRRAQGDRVVVNPRTFSALQNLGRRVVIIHELTHVATRSSTTSPVPIWLTEGMADYIGYSGVGVPPQRLASELLALVRDGKGPTRLPIESDFDPSRTRIAPSYSASWLAVSRLVHLYGQARVVAFYRAIASATATGTAQLDPGVAAAAFPTSFGVTQAQFVRGWRRSLSTLADASR